MATGILRLLLLSGWCVAWLASVVIVGVASLAAAPHSQFLEAAIEVTGIYLPAVGMFAAFWFATDAETREVTVSRPQFLAAVMITVIYLLLTLVVLGVQIFTAAAAQVPPDQPGVSLVEAVSPAARWLVTISTFASAPILYLTGQQSAPSQEP